MTDKKISELTQITGSDVDDANDEIAIVDASTNTTKAITREELFKDIGGNVTLSGTVDGRDVAADGTKLDGIESGADVTDTTNVEAAGSVMVRSIMSDVANVESNSDLTYTASQAGTVSAGDNVITLDGHSFEVAASGATDHHRTTSGGVKLYVLPDARGYNVRAFGATGDGVTDDSPAFSAMFTWVMSDDGGWRKCYAPGGRYIYETQYSTTVDNYDNSAFQGLFFEGDGPSTVIVNKNGKGFFKWVQSAARDVRAKFQNFVIELAKTGSNGIPIHLEQVSGGLSNQPDVELRDIQIAPTSSALDCYVVSNFRIQGFYYPRIVNCSAHSGFASGTTLRRYYKGRISIWLQDCYGYEVIDTKTWGCEEGVRAFEDNNPGGEGGRITRSSIDAWHGVRVYSPGTEPAFTVDDVHINGVATNLEVEQRKLIQARGNWWYMNDTTADASIENLLAYSHDATSWAGTATVTAASDENGFYDVYEISDPDSGVRYLDGNFARTAGTDYVISALLKCVDAAESYVSIVDDGSIYATIVTWDGENEPTLTDGAGVTSEAIDYGDGWWRIVVTRTVSATETAQMRIYPAGGTGSATGSVLFAGAQAQEGTEPTPIVRTEGTTVTEEPVDIRLKDVEECDIHDLTFWFDGSTARKNIVADSDCRRLRFRNLVHNAVVDTAYDLAAGIDEVFISNPRFNAGITNEIADGGVTKLHVMRDEPFFVDENGNVGIGGAPPDALTRLYTAGAGTQVAVLESTDGGAMQLRFKSDSGNRRFLALDNLDNVETQVIFENDAVVLAGPTTSLDTWLTANANGVESGAGVKPASYTVATLPSASTFGAGSMIFVSDETGGATMAFSDGTDWRRVQDRAVVS